MTTIYFSVTDNRITLKSRDAVVSENYQNYLLDFSFDDGWADLAKVVTLKTGSGDPVSIPYSGPFVLPAGAASVGGMKVSVSGYLGTEPMTVARTAVMAHDIPILPAGIAPELPEEYDPTTLDMIFAAIGDLSSLSTDDKRSLVLAINETLVDAKDYADQKFDEAAGYVSEARQAAEEAAQSAAASSASSTAAAFAQSLAQGAASSAVTSATKAETAAAILLKNYLTPEMYGAKGDGTTDDFSAIAACLADAEEKSMPVMLTANYYCSDKITLNEVTVTALERRTLIFPNDLAQPLEIKGSVRLENVYVYKSGLVTTAATTGILVSGSNNVLVDVYVSNYAVGLKLAGTSGVAYNKFVRCYVRNCIEGIYLLNSGSGYANENSFEYCTVRLDSNIRTRIQGFGGDYANKFAVTLDRESEAENNMNNNRFICCNTENCFNGFSVRAYYCLFLDCRTETNTIYYYFHQTNGGYNYVVGTFGQATAQNILELRDDSTELRNNLIIVRQYDMYVGSAIRFYDTNNNQSGIKYVSGSSGGIILQQTTKDIARFTNSLFDFKKKQIRGLRAEAVDTRPTVYSNEAGVCVFDTNLGIPIWWNGAEWVDAAGNNI